MARTFPSVVIEELQPLLDGGDYPIKRIVGEDLAVEADIFKDGHDVVAAVLKWRALGKREWRGKPLIFVGNHPLRGGCTPSYQAGHRNTVGSWADALCRWQKEFSKQ